MPADRRVRQRAKYNHPAIGSKEHKKKWGLPKEVYPPFSTFTRDPRQYAKVPAGMLGEFLKQHYDYEKEKEMARETQKDLYDPTNVVPDRVRHPPLRLQDLEIVRTLGRGQEGSVYMVKVKGKAKGDTCNGVPRIGTGFALKAIPKRILRHVRPADITLHLLDKDNEICKLTTLDWNPFVSGLLQYFDDKQNVYLLLELMPHGTLRDIMNRQSPLSMKDATFYFMNIACGLKHLRDHGIVHRDIKPENILLGRDGYLVLTDFGSSAFASDDDAEWTFIGTPIYGPPETHQAWEDDECRTAELTTEDRYAIDMYCAGMIFFEMIYGRLPFTHEGISDYMQKKCRMICWPTDVLIGVNTKHLIRQLLHYRARFRPTYSDLEESAFFVDGMSDQCWDIVLARQYLPPYIPEDVDLEEAKHTLPLPLKSEVPGLSIRKPPAASMADDIEVEPHGYAPPVNLKELILQYEAGEIN